MTRNWEAEAKKSKERIEDIERGYEARIKKLNDRISAYDKEAEKSYYLNSENKMRLVQ